MNVKDHPGIKRLQSLIHDLTVLHDRREARHAARATPANTETMSEKMFIRAFGSKVWRVRYSNRPDYVGLMILGRSVGFIVRRTSDNKRELRLINVKEHGRLEFTNRRYLLKKPDSLSNMQPGLLRFVE